MSAATCRLCGSPARILADWGAWRCEGCGVRFSALEPRIEAGAELAIDEDSRVLGLRAIRERGHAVVFDAVAAARPLAGARVLDVGSGHGWFLEAAQARGSQAVGIEPDREVAARSRSRGLDVRGGFFPHDLPADERFGLIAFNDVFEHLPDPVAILREVHRRLEPGGLLAISIPTADGLAYRLATGLARAGFGAPLDRLWQRGLPSPHLWYFTERSLEGLVSAHGFAKVAGGRLPSVERRGLRERAAAGSQPGIGQQIALATVWLAAPLLNHPHFSDAMWLLFRRRDHA